MSEISVQKIPKKEITSHGLDDLIAEFCYKFPQYTFVQAKKNVPFKRIVQMLKVARKIRAKEMLELTNVVAGPHTKGGKGTSDMIEYYKRVLNDEE